MAGNCREMSLNGVETSPGAQGCCLAVKNIEIGCLVGWILGNLVIFFSKSDRREVVLGVPRPRKSDLSEKTPDLAVLCPVLAILKF